MSLVIKAKNDWRGVGRPQVAMHRKCHLF